jgi:hypothetical protein
LWFNFFNSQFSKAIIIIGFKGFIMHKIN